MATIRLTRPSIFPYQVELDQVLADLREFSQLNEVKQFRHLQVHLRALDYRLTGNMLNEKRHQLLESHEIFLSMKQEDQVGYIWQYCDYIKGCGPYPHTIRKKLFMVPYVAQYIRTTRSGLYNQRIHGNWFEWHQTHRGNTEINLDSGNAGEQSVREHVREYQQYDQQPLPSLELPPMQNRGYWQLIQQQMEDSRHWESPHDRSHHSGSRDNHRSQQYW
ncbi:hypothetical protein F4811DRAFT_574381 [Daldinia bambusicola]|nr:hypothetical protein F4811DRAFT_574381 [Daldinia bambusicola]